MRDTTTTTPRPRPGRRDTEPPRGGEPPAGAYAPPGAYLPPNGRAAPPPTSPARAARPSSRNGNGSSRPSRRRRQLRLLFPFGIAIAAAVVALPVGGLSVRARHLVSVFPIPGSRLATPQMQIAFRGIPPRALHRIVVRGSQSGLHTGRVEADSDGHGGSFVPNKPFTPGERVTVKTGLHIAGARHGTFQFTIAQPASTQFALGTLAMASRVPGDVLTFHSRPDLSPAAIELAHDTPHIPGGDLFLAPQQGPLQNGPMIVSPSGQLVWFNPIPSGQLATDFRVQRYAGQRVLTWWQGTDRGGVGFGTDVIMNSSYVQIATVHGANGLSADLHEFQLTPRGTALITAYFPVWWKIATPHGTRRQDVLDAVVQEIDLKTGLALFQWNSLDHVPVSASEVALPSSPSTPYDYFHVNAIAQAPGGRLIISARNTWALYELDRQTGRVLWTLGGKHSSFRLGRGVSFAFQHDARVLQSRPDVLTVYDDGAGPPTVHADSRALTIKLDSRHWRATLVRANQHEPAQSAWYEGNVQPLAHGFQFVGWGANAFFSEFDPRGRLVFDGRFVGDNSSYRAYVFGWHGTPRSRPAVAVSRAGSGATVYASWNGATNVASWRVLGGSRPNSLTPIATVPTQGFETAVPILTTTYVAVQALDAHGHVLATSNATHS